MSFTRSHSPILHCYFMDDSNFVLIYDFVIDLGFKFNNSLYPKLHIEIICCETFKVLSFLMRIPSDFTLILVFKHFFLLKFIQF